jgi:hypothetical protein
MDMNPLIYQMCAARLAQSDNPAAAQLLARISGSDGAPPDPREMLQALAAQDPTMQLLMQQFDAMQSARAESGVTIEGEAEGSEDDLPDPRAEAVQELRSQVEAMYQELSMLRRRNDDLALALGACPECWGEDRGCRSCRGRGSPGYARPDTDAFLHYVVPAGKTWRAFKSLEKGEVRARQPGPEGPDSMRFAR